MAEGQEGSIPPNTFVRRYKRTRLHRRGLKMTPKQRDLRLTALNPNYGKLLERIEAQKTPSTPATSETGVLAQAAAIVNKS